MLLAMANDVKRLGRYVAARRKELGLSQIDVWQSGGPSNSTLTGIENGTASSVSTSTLRKLDASLSWAPGSARFALLGEEPVPMVTKGVGAKTEASSRSQANDAIWSGSINRVPDAQILGLILAGASLKAATTAVERGEAPTSDLVHASKVMGDALAPILESFFGGADQMKQLAEAIQATAEGISKSEDERGNQSEQDDESTP